MDKYFKDFLFPSLRFQNDIARLGQFDKAFSLRGYDQMEQLAAQFRKQQMEITQSLKFSWPTLLEANQGWIKLINDATAPSRIFGDIARSHHTWLDKIKSAEDSFTQTQAVINKSIDNITCRMNITEQLFAGIDFNAIQKSIDLPTPTIFSLKNVVYNLTSTYEKLIASIGSISDLTHLPLCVMPGASREVLLTGYTIDTICSKENSDDEKNISEIQLIEDIENETSSCISLLNAIEPALGQLYVGAHDSLGGKNTDRARHILVSLRELWNHLLRCLAPDGNVLAWISSEDKELLHEGRPTRKARVLYVCRTLNHGPLTDFILHDTQALVKLLDFFNRVHELELRLTDEQLRAILLRTDSWLMYILQICK